MRDHHGEHWVPVADAARAVRVRPSAIYNWVHRGKVRAHRHRGRSKVNLLDVQHAEKAWRQRVARPHKKG